MEECEAACIDGSVLDCLLSILSKKGSLLRWEGRFERLGTRVSGVRSTIWIERELVGDAVGWRALLLVPSVCPSLHMDNNGRGGKYLERYPSYKTVSFHHSRFSQGCNKDSKVMKRQMVQWIHVCILTYK